MTLVSLLPSTFITRGVNRSCIVDTEKSTFCVVPNTLAFLFEEKRTLNIKKALVNLESEECEIVNDYIFFLIENNFAVLLEKEISFGSLDDKEIDIPASLYTVVIDTENFEGLYRKIKFFEEIPEAIQLRLFFNVNMDILHNILNYLTVRGFRNIEILINHHNDNSVSNYAKVTATYEMLARLVVMGFNKNYIDNDNRLIYSQYKLTDEHQCGKISDKLFMPNIQQITLSKGCNTCLYKKLSIDKNDNIKSCPSMKESLGIVGVDSFDKIMSSKDTQKFWHISKDQIKICKDCEFRRICTDCRAYTQSEDDLYSKPLKCGYDPFSGKWHDWRANPLNFKAITYYGL